MVVDDTIFSEVSKASAREDSLASSRVLDFRRVESEVNLEALAEELLEKTPAKFRGTSRSELKELACGALREWIVGSHVVPETAVANLSLLKGEGFLKLVTSGVVETIHKRDPDSDDLEMYQSIYREPCERGAWGFFGLYVEGIRSPDGSYDYFLLQNKFHPVIKFKQPRVDSDGEVIKYESFPYMEAYPVLPLVSKTSVEALAARYREVARKKGLVFKPLPRFLTKDRGVIEVKEEKLDEVPVDLIWTGEVVSSSFNYWRFVHKNPFILVGITEGAKKACVLLDLGVPTICLRGITMWRLALFPANDWEFEREFWGNHIGRPLWETIEIQNAIKEEKTNEWMRKTLEDTELELSTKYSDNFVSFALQNIEKDLGEQIKKGFELAAPLGWLNHEERPFVIVFDADPPYKLNTRKNVMAQAFTLANEIAAARAAKSKGLDAFKSVRILHWSAAAGKGIDDYLTRYPTLGEKRVAFDTLYKEKKKALTATEVEKKNKRYRTQEFCIKTYQLVTQLQGDESFPNLRTVTLPPNAKLPPFSEMDAELQKVITQEGGVVLLQSPNGTGKTRFFIDTVQEFLKGGITLAGLRKEDTPFFLGITPTNSLGRQLCTRLNESVSVLEKVAAQQDHADRLARLCYSIGTMDGYQNLAVVLHRFGCLACQNEDIDASKLGRDLDDACALIIEFFLYLEALSEEDKLRAELDRLYRWLVIHFGYYGFPYKTSGNRPFLEAALEGDLTLFFRPLLDFAAIEVSNNKTTTFGKLPDFLGMISCAEGLPATREQSVVPPPFNIWLYDIHNDAIRKDHTARVQKLALLISQIEGYNRLTSVLQMFGLLASQDKGDACILIIEFFLYLDSLIEKKKEAADQHKLFDVLNRLYLSLVSHFGFPLLEELLEEAQAKECPPDLPRFIRPLLDFAAGEVSNFKLVTFIDEIDVVVNNLVSGRTTSPARWGETMTLFKKLLSRSTLVIGAQSNLSPDVVKFIRAFSGKEPHIRVFKYSAPPSNVGNITFYWGSRSSARDTGAFAVGLLQAITQPSKRIFVVTTSNVAAKQIAQFLSQRLPKKKIVEIDSDNAGEELSLELFNDPNAFLKTHQPDVLVVSPCMKTGVSIDCEYFDEVWGLFASGDPMDIVQMLGRVRSNVDRHVWISEYFSATEQAWTEYGTRKHSELLKRVAQENRALYESYYELDIPSLEKKDNSLQVRYRRFTKEQVEALDAVYAANKLKTNYGNFAPAHILMDLYRQWGWNIEHTLLGSLPPTNKFLNQLPPAEREDPCVVAQKWQECLTGIGQEWFDAKDVVIQKTAEDMLASEPVAEEAVPLILSSSKSTRKQRLGAMKTRIYQGLEGMEQYEEDAQTDPDKYNVLMALFRKHLKTRGRFTKGPKILAKTFAWDGCQAQRTKHLKSLTRWGNINPAHLPLDEQRARFLHQVGVDRFLQTFPQGTGYTSEDPEVQELIKNLKENAEEFHRLFGLSIMEDQYAMRMLGNLWRRLGLNQQNIKRKGSDGHRVYIYAITTPDPEWTLVFSRHLDWLNRNNSEHDPPRETNDTPPAISRHLFLERSERA